MIVLRLEVRKWVFTNTHFAIRSTHLNKTLLWGLLPHTVQIGLLMYYTWLILYHCFHLALLLDLWQTSVSPDI